MTVYVIWIMLALLAVYLFRTVTGKTVWDKLHGLSLVAADISIIVALYASLTGLSYFLDIALICAVMGFILPSRLK